MNTQEALNQARELLQEWELESSSPEPFRYDLWIAQENFSTVIQTIHNAKWGYLCTITGVDRPASEESETDVIDVMYHFAEGEAITTIHILLPYDNLRLPTVCDLIPSASIYEREVMEMLGIVLENTPDTNKLVLPDEWPDDIYPLRKSFKRLTTKQIGEAKS